jgi:hypothetical protein
MNAAEQPARAPVGILAWLTALVVMLVCDTILNLCRDRRAAQLAELRAKVERGPGHWEEP